MAFSFSRARGMSMPAVPSFRTLISPAASPTRPTADSQPTSPSHLKWSCIDLTEEEDEDPDHDLYSRTSSFHTPSTSSLPSPATSPGGGPFKMLSPDKEIIDGIDVGDASRRSQYDAVDPMADLGSNSNDLESDLPDVDALPQDVSRLHDIIRANRAALEKRNKALVTAQDRLEKLSRSHDDLLERSSQWKDELETLQASHANVQQQLNTSKADNEGLGEQIKDLRYRSEESRRAILRLQGERKTATAGGSSAGDRRSVAAGSLAGWNPSLLQGDANASATSSEDAAFTAKSSKRSTILFGAPSAAAQRRHARSGSSSNVVASPTPSDAGQESERTPQQPSANGLGGGMRGLRLGYDRRPSGEGGDEREGEGAAAASSSSVPLARRSLLLPPGGGSTSRPPSTQSVSPTPSASGSGLGSPLMGDGQFLPLPSSPALSASGDGDVPTARPTQTFATAGAGMSAMQIVRLKDDELAKMQGELKALRAKLDEAVEGRRASDACLKALKEFIGEGGPEGGEEARAALRGVKLPPLPTDDDEDTVDAGPGARAAAGDSWWTSVMRKASAAQPTAAGTKKVGSSTTAPSTTGAASDALSTSPSNMSNTSGRQSAMDESSPHPSSSSFVSAGPSTSGGLASFGSFFARTASSTSPSPQPPQPPSKSPVNVRPELEGRSCSAGSGTSETSGGGLGASPRRPLNRLSTWFSKPAAAAPDEPAPSGLPTVASPPFASLEESTLHRVDLSATPRKASAGRVDGSSDVNGVGLGLVGASPSDEAAAAPAPPHKDVPLSARAAKADARVADVGEDGLDGGPLVAPTFD